MRLAVELHGTRVGTIDGDARTFDFVPSPEAIEFDEEFGSRLSRRMGLAAFGTTVADFDGLAALVVERYDRSDGTRVHQEDLSQALGAEHNEKYQEMGGVVNLRRVAEVLSQYASARDLHRLARMVVLSVAVGNLDMHTKNIALLHPSTGETLLAPAYDVVPQAQRRQTRARCQRDVPPSGDHPRGPRRRVHLLGAPTCRAADI